MRRQPPRPVASRPAVRLDWRQGVAMLGLLALLLDILAVLNTPAQAAAGPSRWDLALTATTEYCGDHSPAQPASHNHDHCLFCLPLLHGGLGLPPQSPALHRPPRRLDLAFPLQAQTPSYFPRRNPSAAPRAPPIPLIA